MTPSTGSDTGGEHYGLLCKRCDVYVGFGAVGVVEPPQGVTDPDQLNNMCWVCRRTGAEIAAEQIREAFGP